MLRKKKLKSIKQKKATEEKSFNLFFIQSNHIPRSFIKCHIIHVQNEQEYHHRFVLGKKDGLAFLSEHSLIWLS